MRRQRSSAPWETASSAPFPDAWRRAVRRRTLARAIRGVGAALVAAAFLGGCAGSTPPATAGVAASVSLHAPVPEPAPDAWRPLLGVYGGDGLPEMLVRERDGRLELLVRREHAFTLEPGEGDRFRLEPVSDSVAAMPVAARTARFLRDVDAVAGLAIAGVVFERQALGPDGGTFRIDAVRPVSELRREALAAEPPPELTRAEREPELVEVVRLDPTIRLDVRYATTDNFMGAAFYDEPRAFLQRPAAEALVRAHRRLRAYGYGVMIFDAYRPWYVTKMFWDATPERQKDFVADPAGGSRHNRGSAVDLTLYDLETGEAVAMPSGYDEFTERAYPDWPGGTTLQRWRRDLLRRVMEAEAFTGYRYEWWHFDHEDWRAYPVMNRTFDAIRSP